MIDHETELVRLAWRFGVVFGPLAAAVALVLRGPGAAATALGCVVLVVGLFALTGMSLRWAARHGSATVRAVALGGFGVRLVLYVALLVTLSPLSFVDRPTIVLTAPLALLALLAAETRLVLRDRRFWWVEPAAEKGP
jgi:hypothetical protein